MAYLKNLHKITDRFLAGDKQERASTSQPVRPDADSHNKQGLTVQRARKAVTVKLRRNTVQDLL